MNHASRNLVGAALLLAGAAVLAACSTDAGPPTVTAGSPAPAFEAAASDGKTHTLDGLVAKGPVFLYFIKADCPINANAVKYYNRLGEAYAGKATLVGVIDRDAAGFEKWKGKYRPTYPVLFDPEKRIIQEYGAAKSPWVIQVSRGKTIAAAWDGYSEGQLAELNAGLAEAAGSPPTPVDLSGAPGKPTAG